jgi:acetoin utilization deacetylase AcuC-like enzyme
LCVTVLVAVDECFVRHDPGPGHPERPARVEAVVSGLVAAGVDLGRDRIEPRVATDAEIARVHPGDHVERLRRLCTAGGGRLDADTAVCAESFAAIERAAGAGLAAIDALRAGKGDAAFLAVRPPGHHAVPARGMGFCLVNNIAVSAAALRAGGERVLVVDWDAHHGNGTQDVFWDDPDVLYVSLHQWPLYPGTGAAAEIGGPGAPGATLNVPLPPGATGDVFLAALDDVVGPAVARFAPDWVLVSAGYDAHRADPLTDLGLRAGDYAALTERVMAFAPEPGRTVVFLEGGYDLGALHDSVIATVTTLGGSPELPEPVTTGGPGRDAVARRAAALG